MSISLKVEAAAGSDIERVFSESIELSKKLGISVEFDFNKVTCFAVPDGEVHVGVFNYHEAIKSQNQYKFAHSKRN